MESNIIIRKAILHILGSTGLSCSNYLLELSGDVSEFITSNVSRLFTGDDARDCVFDEENSAFFKAMYGMSEDDLTAFSIATAQEMYKIMQSCPSIPAGDLIVASCQINSEMYLAILKVSYRTVLVHGTSEEPEGLCHFIERQEGALISQGAKPAEAALINMNDYSLRVTEKKYDFDGKKDTYFSRLLLGCSGKLSQKAKLDIVTKAVEKTNEEFFSDNVVQRMESKRIMQEEIVQDGSLNLKELPEKLYPANPIAKQEFTEKLEKYNMTEEVVKPRSTATAKKLTRQHLVTDTGIEINIPMEQYTNEDCVEVITADDGTISVIIKNISHISAK